jgi:hypothetical protein
MTEPRWDPCITHRDKAFFAFAAQFFTSARRILLVAGAGFDPRSCEILRILREVSSCNIHAILIVELRTPGDSDLIQRAQVNRSRLVSMATTSDVVDVRIFDTDDAPIGGQQIVDKLRQIDLGSYSDVVIDFSALSVGVSFPVARFMLERARSGPPNVHLAVVDHPNVDRQIRSLPSDRPTAIHGFRGKLGLEEVRKAAKLWMPQLMAGKGGVLRQIHAFVNPDDVVPIIPFPSRDPRTGDELIDEYQVALESEWDVDVRNILHAQEWNPLDLYRSILRIADARERVFGALGGSLIVLSPSGTKLLAVGTMMAAIERDFPVVYLEAASYSATFPEATNTDGEIVHIWLSGEAYG